ncbi:MAG: hypothetical protein NTX50_24005, partial [Candidatus Sumerlaeota bacterium]|nr:hypothetical protein [Candidatus Sumerlaeota bacterium]
MRLFHANQCCGRFASCGALLIFMAAAAALYGPWIETTVAVGNVESDLAAIESLVERGTFCINDSTWLGAIDKMKIGDRFYSHKPPVFQLAAALPYWALFKAGYTLKQDTATCLRVLTLIMVMLPMGWLLWMIYDHPWMKKLAPSARAALTAFFSVGSLLTPFAVTFNHYILAASCLMAAWRA